MKRNTVGTFEGPLLPPSGVMVTVTRETTLSVGPGAASSSQSMAQRRRKGAVLGRPVKLHAKPRDMDLFQVHSQSFTTFESPILRFSRPGPKSLKSTVILKIPIKPDNVEV
jgi:hypothetical protein